MSIGNTGEDLATSYLEEKGYKILDRNFRYRKGEIDIIAYEKGYIVFIEVKTRRNNKYGLPREAVDFHKQKQIYFTAKVYLNSKNKFDSLIRFDVIEVYFDNPPKFVHIKNAFDGNDVEVF